ncbi:MAG TPA: hypothetical protein VEU30_16570, partial [Thermoanaerobaculia bacterium]|nr:hypothetical protein [Thermoanaerobaculia bacterium]
ERVAKLELNDAMDAVRNGRETQESVVQARERLNEARLRIDRWVRTSERILRQRTVGSFEEFLGQSDRAVSYRGGAQKVLTIADNLMNDMYAKLVGLQQPEPFLTSLYDSVDRIQTVVGTGLVRMPSDRLFFLPGMVSDLWHEVGGFHFFKTISASYLGLDLSRPDQQVLYYDLADNYGDLVSLLYGFKLDREQFATALIETWLLSQRPAYWVAHDAALQGSYLPILVRIVAVFEFLLQHTDPIAAAMDRRAVLNVMYEEACEVAERYNSPRVPSAPDPILRRAVVDILESPQFFSGLQKVREKIDADDIKDAVDALQTPVPDEHYDFDQPADLRAFEPEADLNEAFRSLYWAVMQKRRKDGSRPPAFAHTAALTRGAALEYHRRAARRPR